MRTNQAKEQKKYILYLRKSSESEDRQAASIPAQRKEMYELIQKENLKVIAEFEESQSAHDIGRPKFNEMIKLISNGKADAIIVWHLNRIARNALDGGMIIHLLDSHKLLEIRTKTSRHDGSGNDKFMLQIEFAMSKKYSDDLGEIVKRGNRQKFLEKRIWIGIAKPGYLNIQDPITKDNTIAIDPNRFCLLQQTMRLIITGEVSVSEAYRKLVDEWGYRTLQRKRIGNCKLHKSAFYRIISDPYYYGLMIRKEGEIMGTHQPMISKKEFEQLRMRMGKWNKNHSDINLPYRGIIKCGSCGGSICAQEKWQVICSGCKHKFHKGNKLACPNCKLKIADMCKPKILHYVYYGCSRKVEKDCPERKFVEIKDLEKQIDRELSQYEIPEDFKNWAIEYLNEVHDDEEMRQKLITENIVKRITVVKGELSQLIKLWISPENTNKDLISDEEYHEQRKDLSEQRENLEEQLQEADQVQDQYMDLTEKTFNFSTYARYWFAEGDSNTKTLILKSLGYNLTLQGKKVCFPIQKPFFLIRKTYENISEQITKVEPNKKFGDSIKRIDLQEVDSIMSGKQGSNLRPRGPKPRALAI